MAGSLVVFDLGEAELTMPGNSLQHSDGGHFLDCCFLCKGGLAGKGYGDIFMYRGDTPFCSEECREEQIAMDGAAERQRRRRWKPAASANKPTTAAQSSSSSCDAHRTILARAADTAAVV